MKLLIVEDEAPAARRLQTLLSEVASSAEVVEVLDSVEGTVAWLKHPQHPPVDLLLFDIQLADGLSFEIFEQVPVPYPVIFTTAFDEYALRAFQVHSVDYLLKPVSAEALARSLEKFRQHYAAAPSFDVKALLQTLQTGAGQTTYKNRFLVKLGERLLSVSQEEIAYFTSEEKVVVLYTNTGRKYAIDYTLDDLEKFLDPNLFFRLNRQFMARVNALESIHTYFNGKLKVYLTPATDREVMVSRDKAPLFREWLDR
ncbi:DNA-binding response regulator, LytR/AlgR family [Catalinimonas alkaloidigena]|uniref:DNA-binding response regulator, LytR/AlgR family n=1 Tax=Catalinimonas alkaloidigena TaxID=1075417 RepID=A0A1G9DLL9_9BACT|nr:LytTR family DNA-binding domain-containing protein [Catalinimonas alkaloidigena]SDK64793.1 DNA-binding response regulator, LytR/AlgR family [Catalinimonas alkaloidigena]